VPKIFWEKPPPDSGAIFPRTICFPIRGKIERQIKSVSIERVEHCLRVLSNQIGADQKETILSNKKAGLRGERLLGKFGESGLQ